LLFAYTHRCYRMTNRITMNNITTKSTSCLYSE